MLQAIRERVTGIVAIFVLGLLAVPFLFFGVESYIRDVPQDSVATIGDLEITVSEFQTEFARHRAELRQEQGAEYDDLAVNSPEYRREFLGSMIDERLLKNHARELGLEISPNTMAEVIRNIPAFHVDGQFSPEFYRQRLQSIGRSPRQFERELRDDLLVRALPTAVSLSGAITEREVDRWLRLQDETRRLSMVAVDAAQFEDADGVSDEMLQAYYEENTGEFMLPERITLEYIELDTRHMMVDVDVEEEELRQRYEAVQARYMTPERRRAAHILITLDERGDQAAEALALELLERIEDGEDFAELAAEYSEDPGSARDGGDLGWIEPEVMVEEFEDALYAIESTGSVSGPVRTDFGWHLIRLDEIEEPRGQSFEEARVEILDELREERAADLYFEQLERLVDLVYAEPDRLDIVAEEMDLEIRSIGPFSRQEAEGLAADPRVQAEAFSDLVLLDRQLSEPIELDDNQAVVVRVSEHEPARPRELQEVRDEVLARLVRERAMEAARERAEALIAEAGEDGAALDSLAEGEQLELEPLTVSRQDFQLGAQLLDRLFRLPVPGDRPAVHLVEASGGWMVVRLEEVTPGNPAAADESQRQLARQQLRFFQSSQEVQGFLTWLRETTDIQVREERI